jgi:hypothetical protein
MPRQRSAEPRYRRRVVLEITPDESTLLDRLADRHGTIRGAVMAGLIALEADRSAELTAQVEQLTEQLAAAEKRAKTERDRTATGRAAQEAQLADATQSLKGAQAEVKDLRADLRETRAKLSNERDARRAAERARQATQALLVHHAYCGVCDKLVPETEWAEQPWRDGFATYHKPHGFRDRVGVLGRPASLLFWRQHARNGGKL